MRARDSRREASASSDVSRNGDAVARYVVPSNVICLLPVLVGVVLIGVEAVFASYSIDGKMVEFETPAGVVCSSSPGLDRDTFFFVRLLEACGTSCSAPVSVRILARGTGQRVKR